MTTRFSVLLLIAAVLLSYQNKTQSVHTDGTHTASPSDQASAPVNVTYTVAQRYFVNNTITSIDNPKIETSEKFNEIFGRAPVTGQGGSPTDIDFTKQYVIAVMQPETNRATTLTPVSLQKNEKNEVVFTYRVEKGEEKSYTMVPALILIVDKTSDGRVVVQETK
jgi:hypothetical protein